MEFVSAVGLPFAAANPFGYVGPGAGLTTIGALLAVLAMLGLALLGPLLYPIRLLRRRYRQKNLEKSRSEEISSTK